MKPSFPLGLRYFPLSEQYRRRFGGGRVHKLAVSTARSCPNREGTRGTAVCIFCDQWGSAAYEQLAAMPLAEQIRETRERARARYRAERFLVYFQAYTNTFASLARIEALVSEALEQQDVLGVVIGTRPDCLPRAVLRFFSEVARSHYISVELGVQTLDDTQLRFLSRGHTRACSLAALRKLRARPEINTCAHLIFGLPGETDGQLRETARELSALGLDGVKLHNLHVLRNTPLHRLHESGNFEPVTLPEYARRVALFLEHLAPEVAIHRLNAVASRWEDVVAPGWVKEKMGPTQYIRDYLEAHETWQGRLYRGAAHPEEIPVEAGVEAGLENEAGKKETGGASWG